MLIIANSCGCNNAVIKKYELTLATWLTSNVCSRSHIPSLPHIKRIHSERSEKADRANAQEALLRQVLDEGPRRDGLRMTRDREEGAVSPRHCDAPTCSKYRVTNPPSLNHESKSRDQVTISLSMYHVTESPSTYQVIGSQLQRSSDGCVFSDSCQCGKDGRDKGPFSIYDGKIDIPARI